MAWWDEQLEDRRIGNYRIEEKLGQGGMAEVFRAIVVDGGRKGHQVAIKVPMIEEFSAKEVPALLLRFVTEVKLQNAEPIPNVVNLIDAGEVSDKRGNRRPYLVMDYLKGGSLATRLGGSPGDRQHKQSVSDVLRWLTPIATALDALHACKPSRLHRDVKPENILFNSAGAPFLTDFGIATTLAEHCTGTMLTGIGRGSPGSPGYQPPEALSGEKLTSSDQFSLAVTVYEALSGKLPFAGGSPTELFVALARWNIVDLHERRPDLPDTIAAVVMKGMSDKAEGRYGSCSAFANALAESALAPYHGAGSKPSPSRSNPKSLGMPARGQGLPSGHAPSGRPSPIVPPEPRWNNKWLYGVLGVALAAIAAAAVLLWPDEHSPADVATEGTAEGTAENAAEAATATEDTSSATTPEAGTLLVTVDAPCNLSVNGQEKGLLDETSNQRTLDLETGGHRIRCTSTEHSEVFSEEFVQVTARQQVVANLSIRDQLPVVIPDEPRKEPLIADRCRTVIEEQQVCTTEFRDKQACETKTESENIEDIDHDFFASVAVFPNLSSANAACRQEQMQRGLARAAIDGSCDGEVKNFKITCNCSGFPNCVIRASARCVTDREDCRTVQEPFQNCRAVEVPKEICD